MLTLCIDTAYKFLTCALIKDETIVSSVSYECFKRQSEEVFGALKKVFDKAGVDRKNIDAICITKGPGSYTGTRIAMTIGKVIAEELDIELYTISTLCLYAGNKENTMVIMNARANRAYVGVYNSGSIIMEDQVLPLDLIETKDYNVVGDASLFNGEDNYPNIPEAFLATKDSWQKVDKIAYLCPEYLKESENYYR